MAFILHVIAIAMAVSARRRKRLRERRYWFHPRNKNEIKLFKLVRDIKKMKRTRSSSPVESRKILSAAHEEDNDEWITFDHQKKKQPKTSDVSNFSSTTRRQPLWFHQKRIESYFSPVQKRAPPCLQVESSYPEEQNSGKQINVNTEKIVLPCTLTHIPTTLNEKCQFPFRQTKKQIILPKPYSKPQNVNLKKVEFSKLSRVVENNSLMTKKHDSVFIKSKSFEEPDEIMTNDIPFKQPSDLVLHEMFKSKFREKVNDDRKLNVVSVNNSQLLNKKEVSNDNNISDITEGFTLGGQYEPEHGVIIDKILGTCAATVDDVGIDFT